MVEQKNILIVEDEFKVATFIKKGLLTQNLTSEIAFTGFEAINLFKSKHFDLVILDVGLPDISGLEVCQEIRKINSNIPILMLMYRPLISWTIFVN